MSALFKNFLPSCSWTSKIEAGKPAVFCTKHCYFPPSGATRALTFASVWGGEGSAEVPVEAWLAALAVLTLCVVLTVVADPATAIP